MKAYVISFVALLVVGCPSDDPPAPASDAAGSLHDTVVDDTFVRSDAAEPDALPSPDEGPTPDVAPAPDEGSPDVAGSTCTTDDDCLPFVGDLGPCEVPLCEDGECSIDGAPNGTPCDDGDPCTADDACLMSECVGQSSACDDGNDCTEDACDPVSGTCQSAPLDGTPCDDGDLCSGPDLCEEGVCAGTPGECPPCGVDADCAPFDDGNLCNGVPACVAGECQPNPASAVDCSTIPVGACQQAVCAPATGACAVITKPNGSPCEPGGLCVGAGFCNSGKCNGVPKSCDDGNPCTQDQCDDATGCTNAPADGPCDDGNPCTTGDTCLAGKCVGTGGVPCDDGNPCTSDLCDAATASCTHVPAPGPCDDGLACTTGSICQGGVCQGGTVNCDDGDPCTVDSCVGDVCQHVPDDCDDGDPCTDDACEPGVGCVNTMPDECTIDLDCGATDGCVSVSCQCGECLTLPKSCDDGDPCTADACAQGNCIHGPNPGAACDDGNPCTTGETCTAGGSCAGGSNVCELGTETNPAVSCLSIKQSDKTKQTGTYWLRPNANVAKFQAWCDMDINGGGWTRVAAVEAEIALCSLATAIGTSADLLGEPTKTAVLPVSVAGAIPATLKQILVNIPGKGWTIFLSNAPGWGWTNVAKGTIHSANVADYAVLASVNGSGYANLASTPVGSFKGPALLGGNAPSGFTPFLGVGAQATGSFTQDAACATLTSTRGLWSGTWLGAAAWNVPGTIYVR